MKREESDRHTEQLVEDAWERCRWGWEVWMLHGSERKRGIPASCKHSWIYL